MPIYQRTRASVLDALIAVCALIALASAVHSADASDPPRNTELPCGYEVAAIIGATCPWPFGPPPVTARSMNEHGEVVGFVRDCDNPSRNHAWYWSQNTGMIVLPMPPDTYTSHANDINDHRVIVGEYLTLNQPWRGFIYDMKTGDFTTLEPVNPEGQSSACWANAINNDGVVVGARSLGETEQPYNAFIWTPNEDDPSQGTYTDLGVMNGPNSTARDVSDSGIVCGMTGSSGPDRAAFVTDQRLTVTVLDPPEGFDASSARSVNDLGDAVGFVRAYDNGSAGDLRAFYYSNGDFTVLDPPDEFANATGSAVNNSGLVIGFGSNPGASSYGPYIWIDGTLADLNDKTAVDSDLVLSRTFDLNNTGQIVIEGKLLGKTVGVLLEPVETTGADLNRDCKVNGIDLGMLLREWGHSESPADINRDGVVNGADLAMLLGNWTP